MPPFSQFSGLRRVGAGAFFGVIAVILGATSQVIGGKPLELCCCFLNIIIFEIRFE